VARFDVHRTGLRRAPLVVDVQSDLIVDFASRVVIPLLAAPEGKSDQYLPGLKPIITIEREAYVLMTTDLAGMPKSQLGPVIANIEADHRDAVTEALDFLFYGFQAPVMA
jgi:toxin CcdB